MNWIKNLAELYDMMDRKEDRDPRLLPLYHSAVNADITVTIDSQGNFLRAEKLNKVEFGEKDFRMTRVPGTPDSLSRSNQIAPRAMMDRLMYVAGDFDDLLPAAYEGAYRKHHNSYMKQMQDWIASPFSCEAPETVCRYLEKNTLLHDIAGPILLPMLSKATDKEQAEQAVKEDRVFEFVKELYAKGCEQKGTVAKKKTGMALDKLNVRWCIAADEKDEHPAETWRLDNVANCWGAYMHDVMERTGTRGFDHISCKDNVVLVKNWFPWVMAPTCNLSVISGNRQDCQYRFGPYSNSKQMYGVGLETADKAMRMLRYLIEVQGKRYYDRNGITGAIAIWANGSSGCEMPDLDTIFEVEKPDEETVWGRLYHSKMSRTLSGIRDITQAEGAKTVGLMEFRKTSPGRVAIVQCVEISVDELCSNLQQWYENAEWLQTMYQQKKWFQAMGVPTALTIARYGTLARGTCMVGKKNDNTNITYNWYSQLVKCIFFHEQVPMYMVDNLVSLATAIPNSSEKKVGQVYFERKIRIACSMAAAYYNYKEKVYEPMLNREIMDRNYLFGRAWACVEFICSEHRYYQGRKGKHQVNMTFAEKNISGFSNQPCDVLGQALKMVKGVYVPQYPFLEWAANELEEIISCLDAESEYTNSPLRANWILGYSSEKMDLKARKKAIVEAKTQPSKMPEAVAN